MKARSLQRQTVGVVVAAQLLCGLLLCGAALAHERGTRLRALDTQIQGRSDSLLGAIQDAEDPQDNVAIDPAELKLPAQDVYAVYIQGGRLLGSSAAAPPELMARAADQFRDVRVHGARYRVLQREAMRIIDRAEFGGVGLRRPVTIVYAVWERQMWHEIFEAARFYLITIALGTLASVLLVTVLLRGALRPLAELADAARALVVPALQFDAPPSAWEVRELRPLTAVLTEATARLRESFGREQRFVSDAAHELKTAIAVVRSSVQVLMLMPRTGDQYRSGLGRILEDTARVESLVGQMLHLARTEGSQSVATGTVDLHEAVESVVTLLQPFAETAGVRVQTSSAPGLCVRLDPEPAETLLSNLLLNAIQHSQPGSTVCLSAARDTGQRVRLAVNDAGAGIGPDALPHIFERFFREDTSRSRETGGTGLGLAICKSIVDAADGTISAESTPGQGTAVSVTFISA